MRVAAHCHQLSLSTMLDGSTLEVTEVTEIHAYRTCQVEYASCLSENLRHPSRT